MAVTRREYNLSAFWNSDDLLNTLETALADVGYHAAAQTGTILTFTNTAGTTILAEKGKRYLVKQSATSGVGVYSTWDIKRHAATGAIEAVTMVNGGKNYAGTNTITIAGADIGGVTPTDNVTITVSTVSGSQGTTTTWYDKDTTSPYTWGVCCVNNDETKKMGQTYYAFHIPANPTLNPTLYVRSGAGFQSSTNVFTGVAGLDYFSTNVPNSTTQQSFSLVLAKSNATPLRLVTFQSALDSNFVLFQFSDVTKYGDVYRDPFFLSKYSTVTQPWSLDDCFTGGIYSMGKANTVNTSDAQIFVTIAMAPMGKRQAEYGYLPVTQGTYANYRGLFGIYESVYGRRISGANLFEQGVYNRTVYDLVHTSLEYNPVITGLPICNTMIPVPYYMPADFGVVEIVGTNTTSHGDLVSVGATTKWRVVQFANNQESLVYVMTSTAVAKLPSNTPNNSCIAFVCKTVD